MSDHEDIQHLDPDQLLTGFSQTPFTRFFLLSIILHALVIAAFSLTALIELVAPSTAETSTESVESVEDGLEDDAEPHAQSTSTEDANQVTETDSQPAESTATETDTAATNENGKEAAETSDEFDIDLDVLNTP